MTEPQSLATRASPRTLGGLVSIPLFIFTLAAFVTQSSLTQYVQGTLGFRQPFFLLYITHSSLMVLFPIHLLYLILTSPRPIKFYMTSLRATITRRLSPRDHNHSKTDKFPTSRFIGLSLALATGINVPGLLWYAAVSLSSIGDVTALWNTNSIWVYVLTVWLYRMKWEFRKLGAVALASIGVMLDVYGGSNSSPSLPGADTLDLGRKGPTAPVLGDLLTLMASISYALYQVVYKRYAALPNNSEDVNEDDSTTPFVYESLSETSDSGPSSLVVDRRHSPEDEETEKLPFGLYANFLTSCMGICTALPLGIGFPVLHWLSIEEFRLPRDSTTFWCVLAIATAGVIFNSSFMILLGLWGPILTSVGNLLTIVLVLVTDILFNHGSITIWSLLGSGMIVAAFGVLALDIIHHPKCVGG